MPTLSVYNQVNAFVLHPSLLMLEMSVEILVKDLVVELMLNAPLQIVSYHLIFNDQYLIDLFISQHHNVCVKPVLEEVIIF